MVKVCCYAAKVRIRATFSYDQLFDSQAGSLLPDIILRNRSRHSDGREWRE